MDDALATDIVSIYEFTRTGDTESYDTVAKYTGKQAVISPTGTDIQPGYGDVQSFQLFEVFLYDPSLEIANAAKIVNAAGKEFIVDGKPYVVDGPFLHYIRCLCRQVA
jgi:hypothetical protein